MKKWYLIEQFEKTQTRRGRKAIKIGREIFVFKRFNKNGTIYWRCQTINCQVSVTTLNDLGCINGDNHIHESLSSAEYKCKEIEEVIIKRAAEESTQIPKIYSEEMNNLVVDGVDHEEIAAYLNVRQNSILLKAYRAREKTGMKKIRCTKDIDLDNKYGLTSDSKPFVLFDSKDSDRIIGFCSPIGLEILKKCTQVHIDGTFKSTPKIYYQTYGIHCWLFQQMFPAVFVLLGEKTEKVYKKTLSLLKEACLERGIILNPETLVCDFELASINAFKLGLSIKVPGIKVLGCQFHYAQAIRRKVDTIGLKIQYSTNDDIQFFIKSFIALSMVPLHLVDDAFVIILDNKAKLFDKLTQQQSNESNNLNNLLIVNSGRGGRGRGSRGGRSRGRVSRGRGSRGRGRSESASVQNQDSIETSNDSCKLIENFVAYFVDTWFEGSLETKLWNHANTIGPRTNNHVEGFHNRLNKWVSKAHPSIYQLITVFQKIETKASVDYQTRLLGKSGPKRRAIDVEKDNRYDNLLENLENGRIDLEQYLRSCSYLINFNNIMNLI